MKTIFDFTDLLANYRFAGASLRLKEALVKASTLLIILGGISIHLSAQDTVPKPIFIFPNPSTMGSLLAYTCGDGKPNPGFVCFEAPRLIPIAIPNPVDPNVVHITSGSIDGKSGGIASGPTTQDFAAVSTGLVVGLGKGDGTFPNYHLADLQEKGRRAISPKVADFNGDGYRDIILGLEKTVNGTDFSLVTRIYWGSAGNAFNKYSDYDIPRGKIEIGDLNKDGILDFVVRGHKKGPGSENYRYEITIAIGTGNGKFNFQNIADEAGTLNAHYNIKLGDCNQDKFLDLVYAYWDGHNYRIVTRFNNGKGVFITSPVTTSISNVRAPLTGGMYLILGDFNKDGDLDLFARTVKNGAGPRTTLIRGFGNGQGRFDELEYEPGGGSWFITDLHSGDFDKDGNMDIIFGSSGAQDGPSPNLSLYLGDGRGNFRLSTINCNIELTSLAVGNFNGDGFLDVLIASGTSIYILLSNP